MNKKITGLATAISVWVSLERLIPKRFDTPADTIVPVLVCIWGMVGAAAAWKGKVWGYWVLLAFSMIQCIALSFVAKVMGFEDFAKTRGVESVMILLLTGASLLLVSGKHSNTSLGKKRDSTTNLNRTSQARSG